MIITSTQQVIDISERKYRHLDIHPITNIDIMKKMCMHMASIYINMKTFILKLDIID